MAIAIIDAHTERKRENLNDATPRRITAANVFLFPANYQNDIILFINYF